MGIEDFQLNDRIAVITGGARGIGLATATVMAQAGATVIIADLDADATCESAEGLRGQGLRVHAKQLDVTDRSRVTAVADEIEREHGRVDILVNNAGIARTSPALETSDEEWLKVFDINVNGVYWCSRAFGRIMVRHQRGSIVNMASMSGLIVNTPQPQAAYNAAKAAVIHLTKSLAAEWATHGVRVNAISPGYIDTVMTRGGYDDPAWRNVWMPLTPLNRLGQPDEIANCALFLASDASGYVTGSNVVADGGYTVY